MGDFKPYKVVVECKIRGSMQGYICYPVDSYGVPPLGEIREKLVAGDILEATAKTIQRVCGVNLMLSMIKEGTVGIEIGCHVGDTSILFAARNPSALMLVDPYINETKDDDWTGPDTSPEAKTPGTLVAVASPAMPDFTTM